MKIKLLTLSLVTSSLLLAQEVEISAISVESTKLTEVSESAQVSADLGDALSVSVPSIDLSRRSGIANDVLIRGQKRDNISIVVDGTKVCGACVNRMDPPISHIITSQIDEIVVTEGPYDVETFGTMSGGIKIKTKEPQKGFHGSFDFGAGTWNYQKVGAEFTGGTDTVRVLVTATKERSDQYKDGNGDTLSDQIDNYVAKNPNLITDNSGKGDPRFQPAYKDMQAYEKNSVMAKIFVNLTDDQELRLGYTANRSDNVVYANSKMDAIYDDSNIYNTEYVVKNISDIYKDISLQYYYSDVDHPMGTDYRMSSFGARPVITNHLTTTMQGIKLKNNFDLNGFEILFGLDASDRNWDGNYYMNGKPSSIIAEKSIDDSTTKNMAVFAKMDKKYGDLSLSLGARYDSTEITSEDATLSDNDYTGINLSIFSTYDINKENKIFLGVGQASRVPDARELYFRGSKKNMMGTPDLKQTTNQELDLGYELNTDMLRVKVKGFYSILSDYIYIKKGVSVNAFQNVDATVYGAELSGSVYATDDMTIDFGASYKVGQRDEALANQTGTNMADMAPLRANIVASYEYMNNSVASASFRASSAWDEFDGENGEQELDAWTTVDLKVKHTFTKHLNLAIGVNNLLDNTYAVSNTYADLILLTGGATDIMLVNEPGRYVYTNLNLRF